MEPTAQSVPKNKEGLIRRLENMWMDVLEPSYVKNCCRAAWDRLRRVVNAQGGFTQFFTFLAKICGFTKK